MNRIILFLASIVFLIGCKKDPFPEGDMGQPVFSSTISFGGDEIAFVAGENGTVMQAEESTNADSATFNSAYTVSSCENCGPELRLLLRSPLSVNPEDVSDWIQEISTWNLEFSEEEPTSESRLNIEANCGNDFSLGVWRLNGEPLNPDAPSNDIDFDVGAGTYSLDFENQDVLCPGNGPIEIEFNGEEIPCFVSLTYDDNTSLVVASLGPSFDFNTTIYIFTINGTTLLPSDEDSLLVLAESEPVEVCVLAVDSGGDCFAEACITIPPIGADCFTSIAITNAAVIDTTNTQPNTGAFTEIQFRNTEGTLFTSNHPFQANGSIELLSLDPYSEPSLGDQPFAKAVFEVQTNLYDSEGNFFPFSGIIQMALALPE